MFRIRKYNIIIIDKKLVQSCFMRKVDAECHALKWTNYIYWNKSQVSVSGLKGSGHSDEKCSCQCHYSCEHEVKLDALQGVKACSGV